MIAKEFTLISASDVLDLVTNSVAEGRMLEYKQTLPQWSDDDKREFLADVSSFGNAAGGDLIYGIEEAKDGDGKPTGVAKAIKGLSSENLESEILRMEGLVRDGLAPRLQFQIKRIDVLEGNSVILIRIPKSWTGPHMVRFKNWSRFFARTSAGKAQLDVDEIRAAFILSENQRERIEKFRNNRLLKILADETPVGLLSGPRIILHLIPLTSSNHGASVDLAKPMSGALELHALNTGPRRSRVNFDGVFAVSKNPDQPAAFGYVQLFRTGALEAVDCGLFFGEHEARKQLPSISFEKGILAACVANLKILEILEVLPPIIVSITVHGIKGYKLLCRSDLSSFFEKSNFDRETLMLPEIFLAEFPQDCDVLLKPAFDALWQGAGLPRSSSFDDDTGRWKPRG
ncbi:MAG: ATP-binding protein [Verrucomicrobiales bacterium]|nr:ATP-binding protein [Verrucomicrobiales bacterium]